MEKLRHSGGLSYPLPIEIMRATHDLNRIPVLKRYKNRPLQDIIPLVFVMYAVCKDVELHFNEGRLEGPEAEGFGKGEILNELYWQTPLSRGGKCREAEELYDSLVSLGEDLPKPHLPDYLRWYILQRPGVAYTPLFPVFVKNDLSRILESHGARHIYDCGSGLGVVTFAYDGWESYTAFDLGHGNMLVADLLRDLFGRRRAFHASFDYLETEHQIGRYDTIVVNALDRGLYGSNPSCDLDELFDRLLQLHHCRQAVVMVDYGFCVDASYERIRKSLCERKILEEMVFVEKECFLSDTGRSVMLVLNMEGVDSQSVAFKSVSLRPFSAGEGSLALDEIATCHFVLEPRMYSRDVWKYTEVLPAEARKTVTFGSLVKGYLDPDPIVEEENRECLVCLTEDDYARMPPEVLSPKAPHKWTPLRKHKRRMLYCTGPVVSVCFTEDSPYYKVCRTNPGASGYFIPDNTISFIPSEEVDISYFICLLFTSWSLKEALRGIRDMLYERELKPGYRRLPYGYLADIMATRPVEVIEDMERQAAFVREIVRSGEEVVKSDAEYGVVIVGKPLSDVERGDLQSWRIRIVSEMDGLDGLEGILRAKDDGLKDVDAVLFDVNAGSGGAEDRYDGLFDAMQNVGEGLPLVIFSDVALESFDRMERKMYNRLKKNNHVFVFKKDESSVRNAVRDLRDGLDAQRSPDRAVKAKYSTELELARWLDPSGDMALTLVDAMRGEFDDDEDPKKAIDGITLLRKRAERIFNDAKDRGFLPGRPALGGIQQLLEKGEFFDWNDRAFYRLTKTIMPETLSYAMGYFVAITNGAVHDAREGNLDVTGYVNESRSPNIYRSCACILMDLLRWYHGLCQRTDGPFFEETKPFLDDDLVKKVTDGRRDYYYIGRVHLAFVQGLKENLPGKYISLKGLGPERYTPPSGVENEIRYYSSDYKIDR